MLRILSFLLALTCAASAQVPMTGAGLGAPTVVSTNVTFDACGTTDAHEEGGKTLTFSNITVGSGSNRALVVYLSASVLNASLSDITVTWDSGGTNQAMSQIAYTDDTASYNKTTQIWGLVAPTSGNKNLVISWSTNNAEMDVNACSFTNVNQTGGSTTFPHIFSNTGGSTSQTVSVTSATGHYTVANFVDISHYVASTATQTEVWANSSLSVLAYEGQRATGASSTVSFGVTGGSGAWAAVAVDITHP